MHADREFRLARKFHDRIHLATADPGNQFGRRGRWLGFGNDLWVVPMILLRAKRQTQRVKRPGEQHRCWELPSATPLGVDCDLRSRTLEHQLALCETDVEKPTEASEPTYQHIVFSLQQDGGERRGDCSFGRDECSRRYSAARDGVSEEFDGMFAHRLTKLGRDASSRRGPFGAGPSVPGLRSSLAEYLSIRLRSMSLAHIAFCRISQDPVSTRAPA